ncbi:MAG: ornithine carbamoyltransferase [Candidatus Aureabacteria bacterium]|nr:ornithine carbamoyltransferase [Candidatus Auribacterota bacterium]
MKLNSYSKKSAKRDLLELTDLSPDEFNRIFRLTSQLKKKPFQQNLKNKVMGLIFTKSSTRTRVSFEVGIAHLGGKSLFLSPNDIQLGRGETFEDTARVLSRYLNGIIIRTYSHQEVQTLAEFSSIPIINGLTDEAHPCQVLTDLFTIHEKFKTVKNKKIVFFGDCKNNMAHSWLLGASLSGCHLVLSGHPEYKPSSVLWERAQQLAEKHKSVLEWIEDPQEAAKNADVLYTDVWTSMGQEAESIKRKKDLAPWQINSRLMNLASKNAVFMHCLPAHRGEEVTPDVFESKQSIVFDQAENRLHVQKAIMSLFVS